MSSEPELQERSLHDDLLTLPIDDPQARQAGYPTQGYVLLAAHQALLIDTVTQHHLPTLRTLAPRGHRPIALVLTHGHLIGFGDALHQIADELGIPLLLHPLDAARGAVRALGLQFQDPTHSPALRALGIDVIPFPGHTPGHIILRWSAHGGALFTGDSAVGPPIAQHRAGADLLVRPPASLSRDDDTLRDQWIALAGTPPVASFLPLHGCPVLDRAARWPDILESLGRPEPTPDFQ